MVSSANKQVLLLIESGMSFMYMRKRQIKLHGILGRLGQGLVVRGRNQE